MTTNWAGNVTYRAAAVQRPRTLDELRRIVAAAPSVRVLGSGHTFNHLADADEQLTLDGLPADVVIDDDCVSFNAGLKYGALAQHLEGRAALHNLASLPHISVAGAIATGTHGSGTANLATAVRALQLVTSTGDIVEAERGDPDFDGMVVHLGRLGVVTRLTLDTEPYYEVTQRVFEGLSWEHVPDVFDAAYSVSVFTRWDRVEQVWLKGREALPERLFDATPATVERHPIIELDPVNCTRQLGVPGPWWDRLPHFRMGFTPSKGDELQAEYLLPRECAVDAIRALREVPHAGAARVRAAHHRRGLVVDEPDVRPRHARRALHVRAGADRRRAAGDRGRARAVRPAPASGQGPSHPGRLRAGGGLRRARRAAGPARRVQVVAVASPESTTGDSGGGSALT